MRRRRLLRLSLALRCLTLLLLVLPASATGAKTSLHWIATGSNVNKIMKSDPELAAYHFDTSLAYVTGNEDGRHNQVPEGLASIPTLKYESYARFRSDVLNGRIDGSIKAVAYDPEKWSDTPLRERKDPRRYLRLFSQLAQRRGYHVITTPSRDLMAVPGAACGKRKGERLSEAFIRCNVAGAAARYADTYQVQSQVHENQPATYRWFVRRTGQQARAANPDVVFLSGLATSPWNFVATAQMLFDAHDAVDDLVAGHYFTINSSELPIAQEFLRMVQEAGG